MIKIVRFPDDPMKDFFDGLESKWGSVLEQLEKIGIAKNQIDMVRQNFLEESPDILNRKTK